MTTHRILPLAAAITLIASVNTGHAADTNTQTPSLKLNPLVVTSSRMTETADQALSAVSVIDRAEIDQRQPQSTFDLLRTETGVDVTRNGGPGANNSVFLRGTESNHTLTLVDGMRASSATTGQFSWRSLSPSLIERIEIVRGPRASLYGSDAIGGVIQVFTRELDGPRMKVGAGSNSTRRIELGYGGGDKVRYGINMGYEATDGFPAQEKGEGIQEDHGYRSRNASGYLKAPVADDTRLKARFWANEGDVEFSTSNSNLEPATGTQDTRNVTTRVVLEQDLSGSWSHEFGIGYSEDQLENFGARSEDKHNRIRTRRTTADWRHDLVLNQFHMLQFGADFREESVVSEDLVAGTEDFDETLGNAGIFGLWRADYPSLDMEASLRHDDNRDFGSETTYQVAGAVPVNDRVRLRASAGTAFKAPSANELYSPGFFGGQYAGNVNLDPEESRSVEAGLRFQDRGRERASINVFITRIDDLIAYEGANRQAINIGEAEIQGMEVEYGRSLEDWDLTLNATFQRAEDRGNGDRLLRRPDEKASLVLGHDLNARTRLTLEGKIASDRADRNRTLPGYGILNLAASHRLDSGLTLQARLENLTNKQYQLADTYNTQDFAGFISLSWEPGQ